MKTTSARSSEPRRVPTSLRDNYFHNLFTTTQLAEAMDDDFGDLSAEEAPAPPPPPPKVKRSLFAKKITAKIPESDEPVDFFSRAKDVYHTQRAEEERRRQKKLVKLERKRSSASAEVQDGSPSGEKRRRVSEQKDGYSSDDNAVNHDVGMSESRRLVSWSFG